MAGPGGEVCSSCYYYDGQSCRYDFPSFGYPAWINVEATDWCGFWKDAGGATPTEPGTKPGLGTARMVSNRTALGTRSSWQRLDPAGISPVNLANWSYNANGQLVLSYADVDPADEFLVTIQAAATIEGAKKIDQTLGLAIGQNNAVLTNSQVNVNVGEDNHVMELVVFGAGIVTNGTTFELFSQNPGDAAWVIDWHMVCESDGPIPSSQVAMRGGI